MPDPTLTNSAADVSALATTVALFGFTATAGRLLVVSVVADDYAATPPIGYTQSSEMEQETFCGHYLWWKIATGVETSVEYVIGSATVSAWVVTEFDNIDATPYDGSEGQFTTSTSSSYTTPSVSTTSGRRLAIATIGAVGVPDWTTMDTWLNSYTEVKESIQNATATNLIVGAASLVFDGGGTTSSGSTINNVPDAQTGMIIVFKVAVGGEEEAPSGNRKLVKTFVSLAGLVAPFLCDRASGLYLRDNRLVTGKLVAA